MRKALSLVGIVLLFTLAAALIRAGLWVDEWDWFQRAIAFLAGVGLAVASGAIISIVALKGD